MRQLVSVVTDSHVEYFVSDGNGAEQIAKLVNPGLDVASVVQLGVNLADVLALSNGAHAQNVTTRTRIDPPGRTVPELTSSAPVNETPAERKRRLDRERHRAARAQYKPRRPSGRPTKATSGVRVDFDAMLAYLDAHPEGTTSSEIAHALRPPHVVNFELWRKQVANKVANERQKAVRLGTAPPFAFAYTDRGLTLFPRPKLDGGEAVPPLPGPT